MYLDWLAKHDEKKQEIIENAKNAVIRWLENDKRNGGGVLDNLRAGTYDEAMNLGVDDLLFVLMDVDKWLVNGNDVVDDLNDATGWWIWIFDAVCDEVCKGGCDAD